MKVQRLVLYLFLSSLGFVITQLEPLGYLTIQVCLTLLFISGLYFEYRVAKYPFFALLPAFFSTYMFMNCMLSGVIYFAFDLKESTQFIVSDDTVVRGTWYTLVAVQVLWFFFYLVPTFKIERFHSIKWSYIPKSWIYCFLGISVLAFIFSVQQGMYGYVSNNEETRFLSYLKFSLKLGLLSIILLVFYEFKNIKIRPFLYGVIVLNCLMGIMFGSKSTTVMPILLVGLTLYFSHGNISKAYILISILAIIFSYMVIEPFRIYYERGGFRNSQVLSVTELANIYLDSSKYTERSDDKANYAEAFLNRMSYVAPLAKTIEYADQNNYYHTEEWGNLLLSPLYGVIPRFLWESKPLANFGIWASVNIFNLPETTQMGITPQGYAYLVLRFWGVFIFFALYGVMQKIIFNLLYLNVMFLPLYILVYFDVGYPAVVPWTYVSGTLKTLIFLLPLMILFIRHNKKNGHQSMLCNQAVSSV